MALILLIKVLPDVDSSRTFFVSKIFVTKAFAVVPGYPAWYLSHDILLIKVLTMVFNGSCVALVLGDLCLQDLCLQGLRDLWR